MIDDELLYLDDEENEQQDGPSWLVLVVDDDTFVHKMTGMILSKLEYDGKPLTILDAYSGEEARQMMRDNPEIALVLLDVVMETDDAGLQVANYIRNELGNTDVQIVLSTGQPGLNSEKDVVANYGINGYRDKTELTEQKMFSTVCSALYSASNTRQLRAERETLKAALQSISRDLQASDAMDKSLGDAIQDTAQAALDAVSTDGR